MMKTYARVTSKFDCHRGVVLGEWYEVEYETKRRFPSGWRNVAMLKGYYEVKTDYCDLIYVFEKN